jgi:hypothetical protein
MDLDNRFQIISAIQRELNELIVQEEAAEEEMIEGVNN